MIKSIVKYLTLLSVSATTMCFAECQTTFEVEAGYRRDTLEWKFRSPITDDTVSGTHSRLRFKDLDIFLLGAKVRSVDSCYYFRASGDYGWILNGNVRNCTRFNVREDRVSGGFRNKFDDGYVADVSAAIGYPFEFGCCNEILVAPIIGYSWHTQQIRSKSRHHLLRVLPADEIVRIGESEIRNGRPKVQFDWYSPYAGFDVAYLLDQAWAVYGEFEFHFLGRSRRKLNGNRTGETVLDRRHKTKPFQFGFVSTVGANYFFDCDWYAGLSVDFKYFESTRSRKHHGTDGLKHDSRDELTLYSFGINAVLGYIF